jgi:acyl dehydratase
MENKQENSTQNEKPAKVIPEKVRGFNVGQGDLQLNSRDAILYALGLGFSNDPLNRDDLNFTYELAEDFKVFPTIATVLNDTTKMFESLNSCPGLPDFNPMMLLHGEQSLTIYSPITVDSHYYNKTILDNIYDKEKGALLVVKNINYSDKEMKNLAFVNETSLFIRGIGGYDKNKSSGIQQPTIPAIPKSAPTFVLEQTTSPNQAVIYRLSGDYNPLHVDQSMAEMGGFEKPILHGLCFYGITAKLIIAKVAKNDIKQFHHMRARFVGHFFPGEILQVNAWVSPNGTDIVFESKTKERQKTVIVGLIQLKKAPEAKL